jgi:hypothetical protein
MLENAGLTGCACHIEAQRVQRWSRMIFWEIPLVCHPITTGSRIDQSVRSMQRGTFLRGAGSGFDVAA